MTKREYRAYIASEEWQKRRKKFLREHDTCNRCGLYRWLAIIAYDQDLHVHHRNYATVGQESDIDLEPLCARCHEIESFGTSSLREIKGKPCAYCGCPNFDPFGNFCPRCFDARWGIDPPILGTPSPLDSERSIWQVILQSIYSWVGSEQIQDELKRIMQRNTEKAS